MKTSSRSFVAAILIFVPYSTSALTYEDTPQVIEVHGQRESESIDLSWLRDFYTPGDAMPPREAGGGGTIADPTAQDDSSLDCPKKTGMPVIITSGEKVKDEIDFVSKGLYGISLTRTYRSKHTSGLLFGPNWMSNLDYPNLQFGPRSTQYSTLSTFQHITFVRTDGTKFLFAPTSFKFPEKSGLVPQVAIAANYSAKSSTRAGQMSWEQGKGYRLVTPSTTYKYDDGGVLQTVEDHFTGHQLQFQRAESGVIDVSNNAGQSIQLRMGVNGRVAEVRDPAGGIWRYAYDANGLLTSVTSPGNDPDIRQYHYEMTAAAHGYSLLTGISNNGIRYSRYSYYPDGRVQSSGLEGFDQNDNFIYRSSETVVTDARGKATTYNFVDINGDKKITRISSSATSTCGAASAETVYDANGYIDYVLDWNKNKTDYLYNASGQLLAVTEAAGSSEALTKLYSWTGDKISELLYQDINAKPFLRVSYAYSGDRISTEIHTDLAANVSRTINFSYNIRPNGTLASITRSVQLEDGLSSNIDDYDERGNLISRTNSLGHTEQWSDFNGLGLPREYIDSNGQLTKYSYNERGLATFILASGSRATSIDYNHDQSVRSIRYPGGRSIGFKYDASGRVIEKNDATGGSVKTNFYAFDPTSNHLNRKTVSVSSPRKIPYLNNGALAAADSGEFLETTILDSEGRPYTKVGNNGQRMEQRYDANGNLSTVTDALGRATTYEYNARNQLRRVVMADGGVVEYGFDVEGRRNSVIDPRGLRTKYTYNAFGEVVSLLSPDSGLTNYTYDLGGRMVSKANADGKITTFGWDKLSRILSACSAGECKVYTYDEGQYGKGRLARFNDHTGQTEYTYSARGELIGQRNNIYGRVFDTSWSYDTEGRLIEMIYPTGLAIVYEYDEFGRRSAIRSKSKLKKN